MTAVAICLGVYKTRGGGISTLTHTFLTIFLWILTFSASNAQSIQTQGSPYAYVGYNTKILNAVNDEESAEHFSVKCILPNGDTANAIFDYKNRIARNGKRGTYILKPAPLDHLIWRMQIEYNTSLQILVSRYKI